MYASILFAVIFVAAHVALVKSSTCKYPVGHSGCLPKLGSLTAQQKTEFLNRHNYYRSNVYKFRDRNNKFLPIPSNMPLLEWDDDLADVAQRYADTCINQHDTYDQRRLPGKPIVGQNAATGTRNATVIVDLWFSEYTNFEYGVTDEFLKIGHFTQVVWDSTTKIGCGISEGDCKRAICNYYKGGNFADLIATPYSTDPKTSSCSRPDGESLKIGDVYSKHDSFNGPGWYVWDKTTKYVCASDGSMKLYDIKRTMTITENTLEIPTAACDEPDSAGCGHYMRLTKNDHAEYKYSECSENPDTFCPAFCRQCIVTECKTLASKDNPSRSVAVGTVWEYHHEEAYWWIWDFKIKCTPAGNQVLEKKSHIIYY